MLAVCLTTSLTAQKNKKAVLQKLDTQSERFGDSDKEIWGLAEMGYQEEKSSALLQKTLSDYLE